jgi:predicted nucleic acid-binding protein
MTVRVIVAAAEPLIALARINVLHLLKALFGKLCITQTVHAEILPKPSIGQFQDTEPLSRTLAEGWIEVIDSRAGHWQIINPGVDAGEASAIQAACQLWASTHSPTVASSEISNQYRASSA